MAQATYVVSANQSGSDAMTALVAALEAADTTHKGSSAPSYKAAGTPWLDDSASPSLVLKIYDGTDWITLGTLNTTTNLFTPANAQLPDGSTNYAADSVGTDSYAITLSPAPTAYTTGMVIQFKAGTANTGACTLNVNSLGAKTIKKNYNSDLETGDIVQNQLVSVCYDGTNFQLMSRSSATVTTPGLVYLSTQTASASSELTFTSGIDSTYDEYEIHFIDIIPGTDNVGLYMQTSSNGGSSYDSGASDYQWARGFFTAAATGTNSGDTSDPQIVLALELGTGTGETFNGVLKLFKPSGTSVYKQILGSFVQYSQAPNFFGFDIAGMRLSTSAVNALRFYPSSGNIASGSIKLYGVRKT